MVEKINIVKPTIFDPYSQAVKAGKLLVVSNQLPFEVGSKEIVSDDITDQTMKVLENIEAILKKAEASWKDVIKVGIFLKFLAEFEIVNEIIAENFEDINPAKTCLTGILMPGRARVSVEITAITK